jgi:signal transduction histidine kinase
MSEHQDSGSERSMELLPPVTGDALAPPVGVEPAGGRRSGAAATGRDLAALANVLVARLPTTQAIQQALALGLRLLPEGRAVQLFAVEDAGACRLVTVGEATRQHEGGVASSHDKREPGDTLGFGALYDQQVLASRKQARAGDTLLVPLVTAEDALAGVLAVTLDDASARAIGSPSLASLSATLTVLVERWRREQARARRAQALLALGRLADPPALGERGAVPGSEQNAEAEAQLLRDAGAVLRAALPPAALLVLRADAQGDLRRVDGGEAGKGEAAEVQLTAAELARRMEHGAPRVADPKTDGPLWEALAPVRAALEQQAGRQLDTVALAPIVDRGSLVALFAFPLAARTIGLEDALALAGAVATAAGAGMRALRMAEEASAGARARDAFISHAAHELRGPLTSLKGYAQLLARQARKNTVQVPDSMLRSAEAIEEQSARMADMVGELLDASRIQRGTLELLPPTRVDLVALATKVVERQRVSSPLEIVLASDESSLPGVWDAQRVEQILRDLLDNAIRYSPQGQPVSVRLSRAGGMARVAVRDEGVGIEERDQPHIFDYLYRAAGAEQRNLSGLGLGLFICRYLAGRMGGRLTLARSSAAAPTGSEFELLLPLARDA